MKKNDQKKIKVLFMIDNLRGGGAERILSYILRDLDRNKFEPSLFLVIKEGVYLDQVPGDVPVFGIFRNVENIKNLPLKYIYRLYRRTCLELFKIFPAWLSLRSGINKHYDIGISFCEGHNMPLLSLKSHFFNKQIAWIHVDLRIHRCPLGIQRVGHYASRADRIFFVSQDAQKGFLETFPDYNLENKMEVVYNPIDVKGILKQAASSREIHKDEFTILSIGRLTKQKRFDKLISVHENLLRKGIKHQIWILGEGEDRQALEEQTKALDVSKTCHFLGFRNPYAYLKSADLFVMTSDYEGLPVVVCEAMVLEKPIVATCVTGPRELLENGKYGLLTDNNEFAIEEGLRKMILNASFREEYTNKLKENKDKFIFPTNLHEIEQKLQDL